tara:strand:+ start:28 stop:855 length:828 start_codon:yes stop_codon:yes gene_type:complete
MSKTKQEQSTVEAPIMEAPVAVKKEVKSPKDKWEIKQRTYLLTNNYSPLTLTIPSRHTVKHALLYFDKKSNKQRELKYATNQDSPLVDEQKGECTLGHIIFSDGRLTVPAAKQNLQKLLSLYHPLKDKIYKEFKPEIIAEDEVEQLEFQILALNAAQSMDIDQAEAIMRVEKGSKVNEMSSKELKRDLLLFARNQPKLFINLAQDDNVQLRNVAIKAQELGIIILSADNRTFLWGSNNRKLMTIPFDENPYSAMAAWFKTDEGVEVYQTIEKKLF